MNAYAQSPSQKPFFWSYSRLKNFETCPKRHWHLDIQKDIKEEESEELKWGNAVHKALAERIGRGTPLPKGMERYEPWCERILSPNLEGKPPAVLVEQKFAITQAFAPVEFFAKDVWCRGIADVLKLDPADKPRVALAVDWKTGKMLEDQVQLAMMAACIFSHYPEIERIRTEFVWLKHSTSTRKDFKRDDMKNLWRALFPRIEQMKIAHERTSYPPKPSGLCRKFCPVTICPHHGVGSYTGGQ